MLNRKILFYILAEASSWAKLLVEPDSTDKGRT